MSEWSHTQITKNSVGAKCSVIESKLRRISRFVNEACTYDSKWIDDAHCEVLEIIEDIRDILEILASEQSARLTEYEENCSVAGHIRKVMYREDEERDEVANE